MIQPGNFSFIDDFMAGSAFPFLEKNIEFYISQGIGYIISLSEEDPSKYYSDTANHLHFVHIPLFGPPHDHQVLETFSKAINDAKRNNSKLVVHCQYGQERTGCFLAIYLIENKDYSVKQAIKLVRSLRPTSLQTSSMIRFLHNKYGK